MVKPSEEQANAIDITKGMVETDSKQSTISSLFGDKLDSEQWIFGNALI
jgi:hypothetical protein